VIRSILYATDLGLYASYVLQHALALTRSFRADLYVVHAVEPMGLFAESVLQTRAPWREQRVAALSARCLAPEPLGMASCI